MLDRTRKARQFRVQLSLPRSPLCTTLHHYTLVGLRMQG
jgi:hypothetical protein